MIDVRQWVRRLLRLALVWAVDTVSLLVTATLIPGINLNESGTASPLAVAAAAALVLGVVNLVVRPLILLLALPFGFIAVFVIGFVANALALLLTAAVFPDLAVSNVLAAVVGGIVLAAINSVITSFLLIDDDDSFYQNMIERLARRQSFDSVENAVPAFAGMTRRGLVMLEVDGLSYWHARKAIEEGWMPTLRRMMRQNGYQISRVDCGLPSQTSACQAGIMFGDNFDIPSFRWYDKATNKLYVSSKDAPELNARYAHGQGLMRGGSSINNMLNGDARKSLLTFADLFGGSEDEKRRRAEDIYLLMLNPYFFTRTIVLYIGDVILELWQGMMQRINNVQPRLDRLRHFYPFVRAATTIFMRDIEMNLALLDIIRGSPAIYVTYCGYDEVAHHSGPWTKDAFRTLKQFDQQVARIRRAIERKAPRTYELIILSDHGQSFGATFKQRYGHDLKGLIEGFLPQGTSIHQSMGGDDGVLSVASMAGELDNIQRQGMGGRVGRSVARRTERALNQAVVRRQTGTHGSPDEANLVVCGSGNLAQVYFDVADDKLRLSEIDAAYPGVVDALVRHEGIGFVVAYDDDDEPIAFGKAGARNLCTGDVTGEDPLKPYASEHSPVELRAEQVLRVADFPNSGDLIINSTLYPDGTVAAMEELVGNHGGLGGEQTDAFIFHPRDMEVPATRNSADVYRILNERRALPAPPSAAQPEPMRGRDAWALPVLAAGLSRVSVWLGRAARCLVLDRSAYREVARDAYMTGPAVLIAALACTLASLLAQREFSAIDILTRIALWVVAVGVTYAAGRLLGGRRNFTATLRGMSFGLTAFFIQLLTLIEPIAIVARLIALVLTFVGIWFGAVEAQSLKGWRTFILPVVAVLVFIVGAFVGAQLLEGAQITLDTLLRSLGLTPR